MDKINKSYYAIIPANVRYDNDLPPNAKLLYGEITALCNEKGYCWASNSYFSELYNVKKETVSRWVSILAKKNYIKTHIIHKEGTSEISNRYIQINQYPIDNFVNTPIQNNQYPVDKIINTPIDKKVKGNNTVYNNTFNNTINSYSKKNQNEDFPDLALDEKKENKRKKTAPKKEKFGKPEFRKALQELGANPQHIEDWFAVRDKHRAPYTLTALNGFVNECNKHNYPVDLAVQQSAENGWRGFKYSWVKNLENGKGFTNDRQQRSESRKRLADLADKILCDAGWDDKRGNG